LKAPTAQRMVTVASNERYRPSVIRFLRNLLLPTAVSDEEKKLANAIGFFASEHERAAQKSLPVNSLHNYLTLLDHVSQEKNGRPVFGRRLRRIGKTLTDHQGRGGIDKDDRFALLFQDGEYVVKTTKEPDLSRFSSFEIDEMKRLVNLNVLRRVLHRQFSSLEADGTRELDRIKVDLSDFTQEEAWAGAKDPMTDASGHSLPTKRKEIDDMTGLSLLMEKYETRLKEFEAQMAEIKRKLEIVTEASRLLKEEGLSEDEPKPRWP
jgi:hypothetical protein